MFGKYYATSDAAKTEAKSSKEINKEGSSFKLPLRF